MVGEHSGTSQFKLGQRKGINVGGKKAPLYVIGINHQENRLFVGEGENHPGLFTRILCFNANEIDWVSQHSLFEQLSTKGLEVLIKAENFENTESILYEIDQIIYLKFEKPIPLPLATSEIEIYHQNILIAKNKKQL